MPLALDNFVIVGPAVLAVFEALAISGGALVLAGRLSKVIQNRER